MATTMNSQLHTQQVKCLCYFDAAKGISKIIEHRNLNAGWTEQQPSRLWIWFYPPRPRLVRCLITALFYVLAFRKTAYFRLEWIRFYVPDTDIIERSYYPIPAHTAHLQMYPEPCIVLRAVDGQPLPQLSTELR